MNTRDNSNLSSTRPRVDKPNRCQYFTQALQAYRSGQFGAFAAYKSALLSTRTYPEISEQLAQLPTCFPKIDLAELRTLPEDTFGYCYAKHMDDCHLTPLDVSPDVAQQLCHQPLGLRYTLTHDIFHVLLDYDISLVGELGVWSFVAAQHYSPSYNLAAILARYLYPLAVPHKYPQLRASEQRGRRIAKQAVCLIAQPFEHYWSFPLTTVRSCFGLEKCRERASR